MKKILLFIGLAAGAVFLFSGNDANAANLPAGGNILSPYNGQLVEDINGRWVYVQDNLMYILSDAALNQWRSLNPGKYPLKVDLDLWDGNQDLVGKPTILDSI